MKEFSISKLREGLPELSRFLVVIFLACHLLAILSHHRLYSKTSSRTEIIHQVYGGEVPLTKPHFKNQIANGESVNYRFTVFCIPLKSLKTLFVSNYERNVFYVLTSIHAP